MATMIALAQNTEMAAITVLAENTDEFVFACSDVELEESLREAVEASNDDYAFRTQVEEALRLSNLTFADDMHLASLKDGAFSSYAKDEKGYEAEKGCDSKGKKVDTRLEWWPSELCGICYDDLATEMFKGIRCSHQFCHPCMTQYIHTLLEQKRHQIYCPHGSCGEPLTIQECQNFLPVEIVDAWSAFTLEAQIPESQKVYCPFPDCSEMLLNEDVVGLSALGIFNAECPSCNRMFCVRCMVPWHADLDCEEFQKLTTAQRSEEDRQLFKLAEDQKWQRCGKCKALIEMDYGCNHMTCRCGYEFCYECGTGWAGGRPNCTCLRTDENRLLRQS